MAVRSSNEDVGYKLFQNAMKGEWGEVVVVYQSSPEAQKVKLTSSEETALHIAVQDGQTEVVLKLLQAIGNNAAALEIKNLKGDTPLHLAAALGDLKMCHAIAHRETKLVSVRNNEGETPLFLAALNGNEKAFLCLHSHSEEQCSSARTNTGDTILHAAIAGEYFSLAVQIILWHPELVNSMNEDGISPLHILASTPTAFKSNSRLGLCNRLIYQCFFVEKLKGKQTDSKVCPCNQMEENYQVVCKCCSLVIGKTRTKMENAGDAENPQQATSSVQGPTYAITKCFACMTEALLMVDHCLQIGISKLKKIYDEKRRHTWASQIMNLLVDGTTSYIYLQTPGETQPRDKEFGVLPDPAKQNEPGETQPRDKEFGVLPDLGIDQQNEPGTCKDEKMKQPTPVLIAAKMGVTEMVEKILTKFPVAIRDVDIDNKNIVLLAVENRQPHVYNLLLKRKNAQKHLFRQVDKLGNNALHLAAAYGDYRPWLTPGAALQMQWELKWYMFVASSVPPRFPVRENKVPKTPKKIFTDTHKDLQEKGNDWMVKTSESCSVVAALIATVAFATSATVPGGLNESTGQPILIERPAFNAFTISSLLSLCLSVTALVFFLSILTSRYEIHDFSMNLPRKLLLGLTSLFASIVSVLVSFCTGHVFLLDSQMKHVAYPLYAATCLPITIFAIAQLSLYYDLMRVIFKKVPQRSYKEYQH